MTTIAATFSAGGLASGLDTNTIIDSLVKLQSAPLTILQNKQSALKTQITALGDLGSRLASLQEAAAALSGGNVVAGQVSTSAAGFTATATSGVSAGRYAVQVQSLARAAQARSAAFASAGAEVKAGTLHLSVMGGADVPIPIAQGATLADVAKAINGSGAAVQAAVVSTGTSAWLTFSNRDTGVPLNGTTPALSISMAETGSSGQSLGAAVIDGGANASFTLGGIPDPIQRPGNAISDVIPGVTLNLKALTPAPEELVVSRDAPGTAANLQKFVAAYNGVLQLLQKNLQVDQNTDRTTTLAGNGAVRALQSSLQGLVSAKVPGLSSVRALADLGITTAQDGSLALDQTRLGGALDRDAPSVGALFSQKDTGLSAVIDSLVKAQTNGVDGLLTNSKASLNKRVSQMDDDATRLQDRIDAFRAHLVAQFSAMEAVVSQVKSVGQFLTQQEAAQNKS